MGTPATLDALELGLADPEPDPGLEENLAARLIAQGQGSIGLDAAEPRTAIVANLDPGMGPVDRVVVQDDGVGQRSADRQSCGQVELVGVAVGMKHPEQEPGVVARSFGAGRRESHEVHPSRFGAASQR
jgi:hypothetical protein